MRIAIPIWDDKVSPVLDTASRLLIVEVEDRGETSRFNVYLDDQELSRKCLRIRDMEVDTLICGAVSRPFSTMLKASGIDIIPEISGHAEDILKAYLQGDLFHSRFLMPGCKRYRFRQGNSSLSLRKSKKQWRERKGYGLGKR
jgi:predicted Fe-Mo cluster-binding NifX family protein